MQPRRLQCTQGQRGPAATSPTAASKVRTKWLNLFGLSTRRRMRITLRRAPIGQILAGEGSARAPGLLANR